MNTSNPEIEPSFADAIAMIQSADELPVEKKRHWCCSLKRIAEALDRPVTVIPARLSAVRAALTKLHHVPLGLTPKTLRPQVEVALPNLSEFLFFRSARGGLFWEINPMSLAEEYRRNADDCRRQAEKSLNPLDKERMAQDRRTLVDDGAGIGR